MTPDEAIDLGSTSVTIGCDPRITSKLMSDDRFPPSESTLEDHLMRFVTANQDELTETQLADRLGISTKSLREYRQRLNLPRKTKRNPGNDAS